MAHFLTDKRTMEVMPYLVDFSVLLDDTDTILDTEKTTVLIKDSKGVNKTEYILQKKVFSGKMITLVLHNGLDGEDYTIWVTGFGDVTFATNSPVRVIELRVRDTLVGNL